jgi:hypothetical protein
MKKTVLGRPGGQFVDRGTYVMLHMQSDKIPTLPKGVPPIPEQKPVNRVFVGMKRWRRVQLPAIHPSDRVCQPG